MHPDSTAQAGSAAPPIAARVALRAPLTWLALGWQDLRATRFRGLFYGLVFALMGAAIDTVYRTQWQLTMGLTAGFFLVGPFVCTGLYELSRQRERGEPVSLAKSLLCWRRNLGAIAFFAAILTFAMIVWARVSVVLFALDQPPDVDLPLSNLFGGYLIAHLGGNQHRRMVVRYGAR